MSLRFWKRLYRDTGEVLKSMEGALAIQGTKTLCDVKYRVTRYHFHSWRAKKSWIATYNQTKSSCRWHLLVAELHVLLQNKCIICFNRGSKLGTIGTFNASLRSSQNIFPNMCIRQINCSGSTVLSNLTFLDPLSLALHPANTFKNIPWASLGHLLNPKTNEKHDSHPTQARFIRFHNTFTLTGGSHPFVLWTLVFRAFLQRLHLSGVTKVWIITAQNVQTEP